MGEHKESILIWCLVIQIFTATVLGGLFGSGAISGGIALQASLPSSPWSLFTDGIGFWWNSLTFQVPSGGYIASVFFWFLTVVELLMLFLIIRGD
jgi:hypothetical protein